MESRGYSIGNLDVTLILEKPAIKHLKHLIIRNVVGLLKSTANRINIKARTHEKVDSVGESRAIECHVCLLLEKNLVPAKNNNELYTTV